MRYLLAGFLGFLLSGVWFGMQLWLTHTFLKKGRNRLTFFTIACCVYSDCAYPPFERFVRSQFLGLIKREAVGTHRGNASCYLSGKGAERKDAPNRGEAGTPVGLYGSRICGGRPAPYDAVLCDIFAGCVGMRRDLVRLLNALIWCAGIVIQGILAKQTMEKNFVLGQHRTIRQEVSGRIFVPIQSSENGGILYVFPIFGTAEVEQKDG